MEAIASPSVTTVPATSRIASPMDGGLGEICSEAAVGVVSCAFFARRKHGIRPNIRHACLHLVVAPVLLVGRGERSDSRARVKVGEMRCRKGLKEKRGMPSVRVRDGADGDVQLYDIETSVGVRADGIYLPLGAGHNRGFRH